MKKHLSVIVMLIWSLASVWGEGASIVIQNQENWIFWYVVDPAGFEEEETGSPWLAQKAAAYMATEDQPFPFAMLQPGESVSLGGLAEGTHFLLGFFEDRSLVELPVRLVALQVDQSMESRHYDIYSLPELFLAARGVGMLAQFAPAVTLTAASEPAASEAAEAEAVAVAEAEAEEAVAEAPAAEETAVEAEAVQEPDSEEAAAAEEVAVAEAEVVETGVAEAVVAETEVAETEVAVSEVAEAEAEEPAVEAEAVQDPEAAEAEGTAVEEAAIEPAPTAKTSAEATVIAAPPLEEQATPEDVAGAIPVEETAIAELSIEEAPLGPSVLATFSEAYDPVYFTRESRTAFVVLPIASSRAWGKPGTRLEEFSGSYSDGIITLVLRSTQAFARNVSCFFYVFPSRTAGGSSQYTFEARPLADGRAAVVLWEQGRSVPRLVGTAHTEGGEFSWTARAEELPSELAEQLGPAATFDLTTAWLDETSGTWEEFYFTTFALAALTRGIRRGSRPRPRARSRGPRAAPCSPSWPPASRRRRGGPPTTRPRP